jgi:hypothetical protein
VTPKIPQAKHLTKAMRAIGEQKLLLFRTFLWENADEKKFGLIPPAVFLPDADIKSILDWFSLLMTVQDLAYLL